MKKYFPLSLLIILTTFSIGMTAVRGDSLQTQSIAADIRDFQLIDANVGIITIGNNLFLTVDNGNSWDNITPAPSHSLRAVEFLDPAQGFVVTSNFNQDQTISFHLFTTQNSGQTWAQNEIIHYSPLDPDAAVGSITMQFLDSNTGWMFFKRMTSSNFNIGKLFHTSDGGSTWQEKSLPTGGEIFFRSETTGFVVGGIQDQQLFKTTDGGNSWDLFDPSPTDISQISKPNFITGLIGEIATFDRIDDGTTLRILGTENGGQDWVEKAKYRISENEWITALISSVPGEIKILTPGQIITYWQTAEFLEVKERIGRENISKFELIDSNRGWALSHQHQCENSIDPQTCTSSINLIQTQDGGIRWTKVELPIVLTQVSADQIPGFISPQTVPILSRTSLHQGQGFDICDITEITLSNLQIWKNSSPYSAVNLYIGGSARACTNDNLSPEFIRALSIQGWKFIPTWVGPQAACTSYSVTMDWDPSTAYRQGRDQATDAARVARKYGLSFSDTDESGTVIYYDLEAFPTNIPECLNAAKAFINGWVEELNSKGIAAGVYGSVCSSGLKDFYSLANPPDVIWPALWVSDVYSSSITADNLPCISDSMWGENQRIYQYTGDHFETWGNIPINGIDINVVDGIVADLSRVIGVPSSTLNNYSFEDGVLSPWKIAPDEASCSWQIDNTIGNARSGDYYLKLGKSNLQTSCLGARQSLSLTPILGETYRFAVWAKSSSPDSSRSLRLELTGTGVSPESTSQKFSGIGDQWMCLEVAHKINQGNLSGIRVQIKPEDNDGIDLYLDDAHLSLNTGPICAQVIPPTNLIASDSAATDSVNLRWDDVPGATYYKIYRSPDLTSVKTQIGLVLEPRFTDLDGEYFENFYYWVKSCNANSCSIFSPPDQGAFGSPFLDFYDGFETGSPSKWIDQVNSSKLGVCDTSPINGQYQLCISANAQTNAFLVHNLPTETNVLDLNFTLDPNSVNLGSKIIALLSARDTGLNKVVFNVKFAYINSVYRVKVDGQDNLGNNFTSSWFSIPDAPTSITLRWSTTNGQSRSTTPLSGITMLINNNQVVKLTGIANSQLRVDKIFLGAIITREDLGASGKFYLDDFSYDGPLNYRQIRP